MDGRFDLDTRSLDNTEGYHCSYVQGSDYNVRQQKWKTSFMKKRREKEKQSRVRGAKEKLNICMHYPFSSHIVILKPVERRKKRFSYHGNAQHFVRDER